MKKFFLIALLFCFILNINAKEINLAKTAGSAILVESTTGKVLYEKDMNKKMYPASMTKIMTLLLAMEALENNSIKLDDEVYISKNAASMGGTQIFVEEGSKIKLEVLLKGIGIASANDVVVTKKQS